MTRHHPDDELLMSMAAGALGRGPAVVTAAHVERCARCRTRLRELEAVGGALLEDLPPTVLGAEALSLTLARIDASAPSGFPGQTSLPRVAPGRLLATLPGGIAWPRSLREASIDRWRRLGPWVRWSRVRFPGENTNLHLLRVAAGKKLPVHGHRGGELSLVLHGAFLEGGERFEAGDFVEADDSTHHHPVVAADDECVCLVSVEGRLDFRGPIGRVLGLLLGL